MWFSAFPIFFSACIAIQVEKKGKRRKAKEKDAVGKKPGKGELANGKEVEAENKKEKPAAADGEEVECPKKKKAKQAAKGKRQKQMPTDSEGEEVACPKKGKDEPIKSPQKRKPADSSEATPPKKLQVERAGGSNVDERKVPEAGLNLQEPAKSSRVSEELRAQRMREFEELRKSDEDFIIPADHQKRVSWTLQPPSTTSKNADDRWTIGVIMLGQFYVKGVREKTCERVNQKLKTDVKIDKKSGSTLSFKKLGLDRAWKVARALARWD